MISSKLGIKEIRCRHHRSALCTIDDNCLYEDRTLLHREYVQMGDTMLQCVKGRIEKLGK